MVGLHKLLFHVEFSAMLGPFFSLFHLGIVYFDGVRCSMLAGESLERCMREWLRLHWLDVHETRLLIYEELIAIVSFGGASARKKVSEWAASFLQWFFNIGNLDNRWCIEMVLDSLSTRIANWVVEPIVLVTMPIGSPTRRHFHSLVEIPVNSVTLFYMKIHTILRG